jgi:integrase/recombinase XerD
MKSKNVALVHLDESAIAFFMERLTDAPAARVQFELAVLRLFLAYLRGEAIVRLPTVGDQSAIAHIHGRYVDYLRRDRGPEKNSVLVYAPFIRDFLDSQDTGDGRILPDAFDAVTIRNHLARAKAAKDSQLFTV